jgi:hypothetical protein
MFVKKIINSREFLEHARKYLEYPFSRLSTFIYYSRRITKRNIDEIMNADDNPPTPKPKPSIAFKSVLGRPRSAPPSGTRTTRRAPMSTRLIVSA